jgi:hypothetical protein
LWIALLALAASPCFAQFTTANLRGVVVDATGASVPQARVTVINKDTGFVGDNGAKVPKDVAITVPTQIYGSLTGLYRVTTLGTWNLTLERQVGADWLLSAAYVGSGGYHLPGTYQMNPATYIPGASSAGLYLGEPDFYRLQFAVPLSPVERGKTVQQRTIRAR